MTSFHRTWFFLPFTSCHTPLFKPPNNGFWWNCFPSSALMFLSVPLVLEETPQVTAFPHTRALGNLQMGCYIKNLWLGGHAFWYSSTDCVYIRSSRALTFCVKMTLLINLNIIQLGSSFNMSASCVMYKD